MTKIKKILFLILTVSFLTSCEIFSEINDYKVTSEELIKSIINEDYDRALGLIEIDHEAVTNADDIKAGLAIFRDKLVENWGTNIEVSYVKAHKIFTTKKTGSTPPNTTMATVEFHNQKFVGVLQILFDDKSKKILNVQSLDIKSPIPSMTYYWLFGLLAICVPIFNIYMIVRIVKSDLKNKWLKIIAVIFLNFPSFSYMLLGGLTFKFLNFQFLLGISWGYAGFTGSYWTFGIPLGGLYWLMKLRERKRQEKIKAIIGDE